MKFWEKILLSLAAIFLDIYLAKYLMIGSFTPSFSLLFVTMVGISEGMFSGFLSGFCIGFLYDAFSLSYFGLSSLVFGLVGLGVGFARRFFTQYHPIIYAFFFVFPSVFLSEMLLFLLLYLFGKEPLLPSFFLNALGRSLYTSLWAVLVFVFVLNREILAESLERESGF